MMSFPIARQRAFEGYGYFGDLPIAPNAPLVVHEYRDQKNDRDRDTDEPK
jgi:hypothetical protein